MKAREIVFVLLLLAGFAAVLLAAPWAWSGLALAAALFTAVWLLSLALQDAGIVDVFWGPGLIALAWFYHLWGEPGAGWRSLVVAGLVSLWGCRLALHIGVRNIGRGEDFRYAAWREENGPSFWWVSLFKVFLLQAAVAWVIATPSLAARGDSGGAATLVDLAGLALFALGLSWEAVGDWQMLRFQRAPANRGRVMRSGLWSLSRHPNYFGETVLWWGLGLVGLAAGGPIALVGPALLTFLLLKISGVTMLDEGLVERKPGYADYVRDTPAFVPRPRWLRRTRAVLGEEAP
jgi:steroid 5-alpha reductase family enzyme